MFILQRESLDSKKSSSSSGSWPTFLKESIIRRGRSTSRYAVSTRINLSVNISLLFFSQVGMIVKFLLCLRIVFVLSSVSQSMTLIPVKSMPLSFSVSDMNNGGRPFHRKTISPKERRERIEISLWETVDNYFINVRVVHERLG